MFKVNKKDKYVLLFSGGYDSTTILINVLKSGNRNISCVYIDIPNNKDKSKIEIKRCKKILKCLNKEYDIKIPFNIYKSAIVPTKNTCSYTLPYLYITTLIPVLEYDTDYVLFGFIRTDDIWHCYQQFEDSFKSLNCIIRCTRYNNSNYSNCIIWAPLEYHFKKDIIKYIKKYKKIYKLCWTCESPTKKGKPCGKCCTCIKYKKTLKELKIKTK